MGNFTSCLIVSEDSEPQAPSTMTMENLPSPRISIKGKSECQSPKSSYGIPKVKQSVSDISEISTALKAHPILKQLSKQAEDLIIAEMQVYFIPSGREFSTQDIFFIVKSGSIEISSEFQDKKVLYKGQTFGEITLLYNSRYSLTALNDTYLWGIKGYLFRNAIKSIQQSQHSDIKRFIGNLSIFECLTPGQKENLLDLIVREEFSDGELVVTQGETGGVFYIVERGIVSCQKGGREIGKLAKGECFGEQALLDRNAKTPTVVSIGNTQILSISGNDLKKVLEDDLEIIIYQLIAKIALKYAYNLTVTQLDSLIQEMQLRKHSPGESLEVSDNRMRIVLKGVFQNWIYDQEYRVYDFLPNGSYHSVSESHIFELDYNDIYEILDGNLSEISEKNTAYDALKKVNIMRYLPNSKLRDLASTLKTEELTGTIFREGDPGDTIYIVKEGYANVYKNGNHIRTISKNDYFGDRSILLNDNRSATVVARNTITCWTLTKQDFFRLIDPKILGHFLKRIELLDDSVLLSDLETKQFLGKGSFGKVQLVQHKTKGTEYALKSVSRKKIYERDMYEYVVLERKILLELDHPMIIKMVKTLKDRENVYFLTEYVKGKDLFDIIEPYKRVPESIAKFYISCSLLILDHLHSLNILYRDMKPENIMIDENGYPKLIDFGIATKLDDRTYTIRGTPHFMAPEIITGQGYGLPVDFWSLGVMLYEMVYGSLPFGNDYRDPYTIYKSVLTETPSVGRFGEVDELIKQLLDRNPSARGDSQKIMSHDWFRNIDFDQLLGKIVKAPIIPHQFDAHEDTDSDSDEFEDFSVVIEPAGWDYQF